MTLPRVPIERKELSPEHAELIQATLPLVGSRINEITSVFYQKMFSQHPELIADLFNRGNQKQGAQQRALAAAVVTFAGSLIDPGRPGPRSLLERIGHKHASLGITPDQYQIVHDHLMGAVVEVLGADVVTAEIAEAWGRVYWLMAEALVGFERTLYDNAGVDVGDVFRQARITSREDLSGTVTRFTVEAVGGDPLPGHLPGQYVSVGVRLPDGARQLRQYSLVGDGEPGRLTFAVKRVAATEESPAGEVSNWLGDNAHAGDVIDITLPFGDMVVDVDSAGPVVLVSAGIGATPMMGILTALHARACQRRILVVHCEPDAAADVFAGERAAMVADLPEAELVVWYETLRAGDDAREGLADLSAVTLPEEAEFYVCGPNGFLQAIRDQLAAAGIREERVHFELFSPNDWMLG